MRERPGSTLREPDWWRDQIAHCPEPTVYVVEIDNESHREALAEHMPLIVENGRAAAFGPCRKNGA
jgi:hypothetical protein